jgi:AcrR family transcriptional regulator
MARLREFDEDEVLESALHVFWEHGYEGASLAALLAAMGMTKSSLYKAFGSKEELFRLATARYHEKYLAFKTAALAEPTSRAIVERLLNGMLDLHFGKHTPRGCMELNSSVACSEESESLRLEVVRNRDALQPLLRKRFDETGGLPPGMSSKDAAALVTTLIQGMAVRARGGATREVMRGVVNALLAVWP